MQRYRLEKVVVGAGVGKLRNNPKFAEAVLPDIIQDFEAIVGQHPSTRGAKKSISTFKTRTGDIVGIMATLRGKKAKHFLDRLINVALPRVRDFRGINPRSFDDRGHISIGIKEHVVFPEINQEKTQIVYGFQVTVVGNTKNKTEGMEFAKELGIPMMKPTEGKKS